MVEGSEQSVAWQQARNSTQADADALAFTFAGFGNEDSVSGYEYMYSTGGRESEWVSVGQQVREFYQSITCVIYRSHQQIFILVFLQYFVLVWNAGLSVNDVTDIAVRSIDFEGVRSAPVYGHLFVDQRAAILTGVDVTMSLDWSRVFQFDALHASLLFHVYVGTTHASSNYVMALMTSDTQLSFTSTKLTSPGEVHVVINAVTPAGLQTQYDFVIFM